MFSTLIASFPPCSIIFPRVWRWRVANKSRLDSSHRMQHMNRSSPKTSWDCQGGCLTKSCERKKLGSSQVVCMWCHNDKKNTDGSNACKLHYFCVRDDLKRHNIPLLGKACSKQRRDVLQAIGSDQPPKTPKSQAHPHSTKKRKRWDHGVNCHEVPTQVQINMCLIEFRTAVKKERYWISLARPAYGM